MNKKAFTPHYFFSTKKDVEGFFQHHFFPTKKDVEGFFQHHFFPTKKDVEGFTQHYFFPTKKDVEGFFQHHFFPTKKDVEGFTQHYFFSKKSSAGFTLIELLIVVAIIAILASVIFVALNPLTRFQDSRDSARWQDVSAISQAIKLDQVDNGGNYLYAIANMTSGTVYMISSVGTLSGCDNNNIYCDVNVDSDGACVDLSGLVVDGYIGKVPVSPNGDPDVTWGENITGYTLERESSGIIHVRACERENSNEIIISR